MADGLALADNLTLPLEAITQKFAVFGQSGSGKSYAAMKLIEQMLGVGAQVIILDAVGVWWGLRSSADGTGPGFPITVFGGEHGDLPLPPGSGALVANLLVERGIGAVLDISEYELPDHKRFVRDFAEAFFQAKKGRRTPVHLVLEEAQVIAPLNPEKDETTMLNRIERLCRIGRNYGVGWTLISQRPQDVHTKVRNQAGTLLALRTLGTHERKAIAEWVSDKARNRGEMSLMERLPDLPTGTAVVWSPAFLKVSATVAIAPRRTFDSSATPEFGGAAVEPTALAPVEVAALRAALAATLAESAASDPAALRAKVADLERRLRERPAPPVPERVVERVAVPVVPRGLVERLEHVERAIGHWLPTIRQTGDEMARLCDDIRDWRADLAIGNGASPPVPVPQPPPPPAPAPAPVTVVAPRPTPTPARVPGGAGALSGGERKILTVLAQYPQGRTRVQAAILAGYSSNGGGYGNLLGALRTKGLLVGSDPLRITGAGRDALGGWEPLPTGRALLDHWLARLPGMQRAILAHLAESYPRGRTREQLGAATGYAVGGGAFGNAVGRLRTLELVCGSASDLRANPALMG